MVKTQMSQTDNRKGMKISPALKAVVDARRAELGMTVESYLWRTVTLDVGCRSPLLRGVTA